LREQLYSRNALQFANTTSALQFARNANALQFAPISPLFVGNVMCGEPFCLGLPLLEFVIISFCISFFLSLILVPQAKVSRFSKLIGEYLVAVGGIFLLAGTCPMGAGPKLTCGIIVSTCSLLFPLREHLADIKFPPVA